MKVKRYIVVAIEFEGDNITDNLVDEIVSDLDYDFITDNEDGIVITDTEIVGLYNEQPYNMT